MPYQKLERKKTQNIFKARKNFSLQQAFSCFKEGEQIENFIVKETTLEDSVSFAKILVIKLYTKKYYFCILKSLIFQTTILIP